MTRIKLITILGIVLALLVIFLGFNGRFSQRHGNAYYTVKDRWQLPFTLQEVSGIVWLGDHKVAAVQDEDGSIFIYDLKAKQVEEEIEFGDPGDYEGIAVKDADAFVLRSDGAILEINNFRDGQRTVKTYETRFTERNNMESLAIDPDENRLLISPKDHDLDSDNFKGIYAFSLENKKLASQPVLRIDLTDSILSRFRDNDLYKTFRPSDLAIHPKSKEIYVLEGTKPKLLILGADGNPKKAYALDKKMFPQPEGITFSPNGTLYISSEGKKDTHGTITQLEFKG
ncbi:MAG TPA: SdiA-regulated domain-containing protein [Pricia sp.]|nr:SdiA-regulated domain-containing protein [Pricia sp.]